MYSFGAGVFYPKYYYSFELVNNKPMMRYSNGAYGVLEKADGTQPEIDLHFGRIGNNFKSYIDLFFLTDKPYSDLRIYNLSFEWEFNTKTYLENAEFLMPSKIYSIDAPEKELSFPMFLTNGKYYWTQAACVKPLDKNKTFPEINFGKLFKGKKEGDKFPCKIYIKYQFDDENIKELIFEYNVTVGKNWYVSPFAGM